MTDSAPLRFCLVGLPETGKTTYIAALWAYVSAAGPPEKYHVEPDKYPADAAYLNEIADAWARGKDMPRNDSTPTPRIEFEVAAGERRSLLFRLPDLRGEVYKQIVSRAGRPRHG